MKKLLPALTALFVLGTSCFAPAFATSPARNDRGETSELSGKTLEQLIAICDRINSVELTECSANYATNKDGSEWHTCKQRANDRMFACYRTANSVTGNGAHVAP